MSANNYYTALYSIISDSNEITMKIINQIIDNISKVSWTFVRIIAIATNSAINKTIETFESKYDTNSNMITYVNCHETSLVIIILSGGLNNNM